MDTYRTILVVKTPRNHSLTDITYQKYDQIDKAIWYTLPRVDDIFYDWYKEAHSSENEVQLYLETVENPITRLSEWYAEDIPKTPPYPAGCLLWWGTQTAAQTSEYRENLVEDTSYWMVDNG